MSLSSQKGVFDRQFEVIFMVLNIFASNLRILCRQDTPRKTKSVETFIIKKE